MIRKVLRKSKVEWIKRKLAPKYYPGQKKRAKKVARILKRDFLQSLGSTNIAMYDGELFWLER